MRDLIYLIRPNVDVAWWVCPNPPLGLGYLASYLESKGFRVDILDLTILHVSTATLIQLFKKNTPLLVGLTALTPFYLNMKELSLEIKKQIPDIPVVLGGVHASALPRESLDECNADFVVIGEGEETLLELARKVKEHGDLADVAGIAYKRGREFIVNKPRELISDLDSLPMPAWHKIDPRKYPPVPHGFIKKHKYVAPILSTRGCPYKCSYCASCQFWRQRIRFRSPSMVVDEMEYLYNTFQIREFHFWDDNLTLKRAHILGICKEILRRRLSVSMTTPNGLRVDTLNKSILMVMKKAGFYHLTFSVESGSPRILRESNKVTNLRTIAQNTRIAKKLGFSLSSFFMLGFPNETLESIQRTIKLAKALPLDQRLFFILRPLPGSQLFSEMIKKQGPISDWTSINFFKGNEDSTIIGGHTMQEWQKKAYRETILRFPNILQYFWFRFLKYFQPDQLKYQIQRIIFVLLENSRIFHPT
jgi:anaerobic magnesium-protoporphyrin IX monomethyl ester cyclase